MADWELWTICNITVIKFPTWTERIAHIHSACHVIARASQQIETMGATLQFANRILVSSKRSLTYATYLGRAIHFYHPAVPHFDGLVDTTGGNVVRVVLVPVEGEDFRHTGRGGECCWGESRPRPGDMGIRSGGE